jgi:hypothetical protein
MSKTWRRWATIFAAVQLAGLVCMCIWPYAKAAYSFLWGTAFIALFPGNLLAAMLIEKLFWNSGLSLTAMSAIEMPVLVALNAALWFSVIGVVRRLLGLRSR